MIDPNVIHPVQTSDGKTWPHTWYLKNCIQQDNISIGDFSYYNDFQVQTAAEIRQLLLPYTYPEAPEQVIIGKFVQIAHGVQIISSSANHQMDGFSTYPFAVFGEPWSSSYQPNWPAPRNTNIGHDVWIGHQAVILPGVKVGDGAIIGARSVVSKNVDPYCVVAGNPAKVIRQRFPQKFIDKLLEIAWWHWPQQKITANLAAITAGNIGLLKSIES